MVIGVLVDHLFRQHRFELDHGHVAESFKVPGLVEHIGHAAGHPGGEIAPGLAEHHHNAAGHVFAAMVAGTLDHRHRAGVTHRKALAGDAAEIAFALDRAVHHGVADDDGL